ncbi:MAG TPA: GNAT family N-acetyltransferase [Candidatus Sulfotelmatobacter sp.]
MEIRFLTSDDASEWWRLRLQALQGDPEAFSSSVEEHQALTSEDVAGRLGFRNEASFVAGAFDEGHLVGMAGFFREPGPKVRHKGRIWGVYLAPEHRGKGLGRKLLQVVIERGIATPGLEQILLSVASTQTTAANLYRSLGFERIGMEPKALKIGDRRIDEEYMALFVEQGQP